MDIAPAVIHVLVPSLFVLFLYGATAMMAFGENLTFGIYKGLLAGADTFFGVYLGIIISSLFGPVEKPKPTDGDQNTITYTEAPG